MEDCKCKDLCKRLDELEKKVQAIEEAISSLQSDHLDIGQVDNRIHEVFQRLYSSLSQ